MIQFLRDDIDTLVVHSEIGLYDKMTNSDYAVLVKVTSQLTGKSKSFRATTTYTYKDRYLILTVFIVASSVAENLTAGVVFLGSTDYPLGFYDLNIYQNTDNTNLDPTGLTVIYTGLANLSPTSDAEPVEYTEYTTNDSDTESVYITF
tara:strand:- start:3 stop:446 length:444 start_codon:yes stop_codon:yes gene_type:complete